MRGGCQIARPRGQLTCCCCMRQRSLRSTARGRREEELPRRTQPSLRRSLPLMQAGTRILPTSAMSCFPAAVLLVSCGPSTCSSLEHSALLVPLQNRKNHDLMDWNVLVFAPGESHSLCSCASGEKECLENRRAYKSE